MYILRSPFDCSCWNFALRSRVGSLFIYSAILVLGQWSNEHLRQYICQKTLLMLYYRLVNSHILYGILVWGSTNHSILQPFPSPSKLNYKNYLQCQQKREHVKNNTLYHELKVLKVKDMYHLKMAKFIYLFQ